ncbi:MAG TPA: SURF1 family cytochrome oxidase biogenesis protein, partial [Mycobacterium sp.]|nr:SURF1 family cytochrome oxidase biogenesis protein [Mycobacterium sp.]
MWSVARRPRWIAMLVLALAVAAGFAALSQWQLARSVATGTVVVRTTETPVPLASIAQPQHPVTTASDGQLVAVSGTWAPKDYLLVSDRLNHGASGYWVVGHLSTNDAVGVAVALGWTDSRERAESVLAGLSAGTTSAEVTGRYLASEGPQDSKFEQGQLSTLSEGAMVNLWHTVDAKGVYGGYIVAQDAAAGLDTIDSPPPSSEVELNWLNLFYAAEWVVFAGFAIFLWYRLVRDAWER